jgi:stringent starvation protein B
VVAIYARENGQGMAFPVPAATGAAGAPDATAGEAPGPRTGLRLASSEPDAVQVPHEADTSAGESPQAPEPDPASPAPGGGRPSLKRIK